MKEISILGSCVTRDAFEIESKNKPRIKFYAARTSFASSFASEAFPLSLEDLDPSGAVKSPWQRKMIEQDLKKGVVNELRSLDAGDTIILDFIDERFDLLSYNGYIATYSAELRKEADVVNNITGIQLIENKSPEHMFYWKKGFSKFASLAQEKSLKVILNNCLWAHYKDDGSIAMNVDIIDRVNSFLEELYLFAKDNCDLNLIFEEEFKFTASTNHKWSQAPFHFTEEFYKYFNERLDVLS